jgi:hypothetical protein
MVSGVLRGEIWVGCGPFKPGEVNPAAMPWYELAHHAATIVETSGPAFTFAE